VDVRLAGGSLTVRDHGPGISPDDAPHVFDRFYRSLSARAVPGSGLGLAVVREIARGHSGTAEAEIAPGGGTLLRVRLPTLPTPRHKSRCPPLLQTGRPRSFARSAPFAPGWHFRRPRQIRQAVNRKPSIFNAIALFSLMEI
jgi:hypothetical protein